MRAVILPGFHFSVGILPRLFTKVQKKLRMGVVFHDNCKYNLNSEDQKDVNKLFGIGYLPWHHINSVRFGWVYHPPTGRMEIWAYWYSKGRREMTYMTDVDLNEEYIYTIELNKDNSKHRLTIERNGRVLAARMITDVKTSSLCYMLHPYFGGNRRAPHKMTIDIFEDIVKP